MRYAVILLITVLSPLGAPAAEESDVLFFAPFEDSLHAQLAADQGKPIASDHAVYGPGVRGQAVALGPDARLRYPFPKNCLTSEGTLMMWVKPEWRSDDGQFHYLFRASTGHFDGKALNCIMLYKYHTQDKLQFYTSDGRQTSPQEGRSIAACEPVAWQPGRWVHVAATWSATLAGTETVLYIDGQRRGAVSGAVSVPDRAPDAFEIGGGRGTTWFDDVLVFSRPLLAREIEDIYRAGRDGASEPPVDLPFASSPDLQLSPYMLFDENKLAVEVGYRSARHQLGAGPGTVRVAASSGGTRVHEEVPATDVGVVRVALDADGLGPGPCELEASLSNHRGTTLRTGRLTYVVPQRPEWLGNHLGKADRVLPPWTPVHVAPGAVEMWGRKYAFEPERSPLPSQVTSQGRTLLKAPVCMSVSAHGSSELLDAPLVGQIHGSEAMAAGQWKGRLGPLDCTATGRFEFDGFSWFEFRLSADHPVELDALDLTVPFAEGAATLYHHANGTWTELSDAGGVPNRALRTSGRLAPALVPGGLRPQAAGLNGSSTIEIKALPFVPYVWLGNEQGGLAWYCESGAGWQNADAERAVEIVQTADGTELRIHFVDHRVTLTEPLRLSFGLMATPVKPMPDDWPNWREVNISNTRVDRFVKSQAPVPGCRNIALLWHTNVGSFSYLPTDPAAMRAKVELLHRGGWQHVISYFALDDTQVGTPDFAVMERQWRRNPYTEGSLSDGGAFGAVCNASSWADFLVWAAAKTMDETGTDGIYLDCSNPDFCRSVYHGCAPGRYPLLGTRELQKRLYAMVHQKRGPAGFVYNHNSENNIITTFSFSDAVLNGEQYNRKDLAGLTWEKFRAELSWQPYGVPAFLLPTLTKFQPGGKEKMPGLEFLAFPLLHDVVCVHSYLGPETREELKAIEQAMCRFGVAEAKFLPYWDAASPLAASTPGVRASAYLRRDGRAALLIAQGAAGPAATELTFGVAMAGLRGAAAHGVPHGEALAWKDGRLVWPLGDKRVHLAIVGSD